MPAHNLVVICGVAFMAVFAVLAVLAGVMRLLTTLFPPPDEPSDGSIDPAIITAITAGMKAAYPGARVTGIEEVQ